jgi:hypothetical protein
VTESATVSAAAADLSIASYRLSQVLSALGAWLRRRPPQARFDPLAQAARLLEVAISRGEGVRSCMWAARVGCGRGRLAGSAGWRAQPG